MPNIDPRLIAIRDCLYRVVVKAVIVQNHRLLVVQEKEGYFGLPGGGLDYGETVTIALQRELQEEVGLAVADYIIDNRPLAISSLGTIHDIPRVHILYRVDLINDRVRQNELPYSWVDEASFGALELSPALVELQYFISNCIANY